MSYTIINIIDSFRCRALHRRAKDFVHDNCCLANTTALQLQSKLCNDNVICTSYKNEVCPNKIIHAKFCHNVYISTKTPQVLKSCGQEKKLA